MFQWQCLTLPEALAVTDSLYLLTYLINVRAMAQDTAQSKTACHVGTSSQACSVNDWLSFSDTRGNKSACSHIVLEYESHRSHIAHCKSYICEACLRHYPWRCVVYYKTLRGAQLTDVKQILSSHKGPVYPQSKWFTIKF